MFPYHGLKRGKGSAQRAGQRPRAPQDRARALSPKLFLFTGTKAENFGESSPLNQSLVVLDRQLDLPSIYVFTSRDSQQQNYKMVLYQPGRYKKEPEGISKRGLPLKPNKRDCSEDKTPECLRLGDCATEMQSCPSSALMALQKTAGRQWRPEYRLRQGRKVPRKASRSGICSESSPTRPFRFRSARASEKTKQDLYVQVQGDLWITQTKRIPKDFPNPLPPGPNKRASKSKDKRT